MNPVLDLFLDHFLNSASCLRITKKVSNEFVVLLRLCIDPFGSFGRHFVGRLSGRALVSSGTAESFVDFCAKARGPTVHQRQFVKNRISDAGLGG
jgi:hypothetical protein